MGLSHAGKNCAEYLCEKLKIVNTNAKLYAIYTLGLMGERACVAVVELVKIMGEDDEEIAWYAREAIGEIGSCAIDAVPVLILSLKNSDPAVRRSAARALGGIGKAAKECIPILFDLLDKSNEESIETPWLIWALSKVDANSRDSFKVIAKMISAESLEVKEAAFDALAEYGSLNDSMVDKYNDIKDKLNKKLVSMNSSRGNSNRGPLKRSELTIGSIHRIIEKIEAILAKSNQVPIGH